MKVTPTWTTKFKFIRMDDSSAEKKVNDAFFEGYLPYKGWAEMQTNSGIIILYRSQQISEEEANAGDRARIFGSFEVPAPEGS